MHDDSTLTARDWSVDHDKGRIPIALGVTIAWHPDVKRVGDRVCFAASTTAVSRAAPVFHAPDGRPSGPIADRHISRSPVVFSRIAGGLRVTGRAIVDGEPLDGARDLGDSALARGVTVELAQRVTLLLYPVPITASGGADSDLVGHSVAMEQLRTEVTRAGLTPAHVMLRGETGVGKELVARAIHRASGRSRGPYRAVNVAAIPEATAASAFFGHVRGAFSGADRGQPGYFGESDGGTLLLDEIGDLPPALQPMLLRALESGDIQPVGAPRARSVDVRVIAATDRPLEEAVEAGRFSRPLLHRLAAVELRVPPIRERRDDIARLLVFALRAELTRLGAASRLVDPSSQGRPWLDAGSVAAMCRHDWPGNVRELFNVVRQIALAGHRHPWVSIADVPALRRILAESTAGQPSPPTIEATPPSAHGQCLEAHEPEGLTDEVVLEALREARWSVAHAAGRLGVARTTVYRYIERTGIVRRAADIPEDEIRAVVAACGGDREAACDRLRISPRALTMRLNALAATNGAASRTRVS